LSGFELLTALFLGPTFLTVQFSKTEFAAGMGRRQLNLSMLAPKAGTVKWFLTGMPLKRGLL